MVYDVKQIIDGKDRESWTYKDRVDKLYGLTKNKSLSKDDAKYVLDKLIDKSYTKSFQQQLDGNKNFAEKVDKLGYMLNEHIDKVETATNPGKVEIGEEEDLGDYKSNGFFAKLRNFYNSTAGKITAAAAAGLVSTALIFGCGKTEEPKKTKVPKPSKSAEYVLSEKEAMENKLDAAILRQDKLEDESEKGIDYTKNLELKISAQYTELVEKSEAEHKEVTGKIEDLEGKVDSVAKDVKGIGEKLDSKPYPVPEPAVEPIPEPEPEPEQEPKPEPYIPEPEPEVPSLVQLYNDFMNYVDGTREDGSESDDDDLSVLQYEIGRSLNLSRYADISEEQVAEKMKVREYVEKGKAKETDSKPGREEAIKKQNLDSGKGDNSLSLGGYGVRYAGLEGGEDEVATDAISTSAELEEIVAYDPWGTFVKNAERRRKGENPQWKWELVRGEYCQLMKDMSQALNDGRISQVQAEYMAKRGLQILNEEIEKQKEKPMGNGKRFFRNRIRNAIRNLCVGLWHMGIPKNHDTAETEKVLNGEALLGSGDRTSKGEDFKEAAKCFPGAAAEIYGAYRLIGSAGGGGGHGGINGGEDIITGGETGGAGGL